MRKTPPELLVTEQGGKKLGILSSCNTIADVAVAFLPSMWYCASRVQLEGFMSKLTGLEDGSSAHEGRQDRHRAPVWLAISNNQA